jgi:hypothetical protein
MVSSLKSPSKRNLLKNRIAKLDDAEERLNQLEPDDEEGKQNKEKLLKNIQKQRDADTK